MNLKEAKGIRKRISESGKLPLKGEYVYVGWETEYPKFKHWCYWLDYRGDKMVLVRQSKHPYKGWMEDKQTYDSKRRKWGL